MKKLLILLTCSVIIFNACSEKKAKDENISTDVVNVPTGDTSALPVMTFEKETHDFGDITEGEKVTFEYIFTNTGKGDLVISSAKGSCGCTVSEYPTKPLKSGEKSSIKVTFDSQGKEGFSKKEVIVITNAQPNTKILTFQVNVMSPKDK